MSCSQQQKWKRCGDVNISAWRTCHVHFGCTLIVYWEFWPPLRLSCCCYLICVYIFLAYFPFNDLIACDKLMTHHRCPTGRTELCLCLQRWTSKGNHLQMVPLLLGQITLWLKKKKYSDSISGGSSPVSTSCRNWLKVSLMCRGAKISSNRNKSS